MLFSDWAKKEQHAVNLETGDRKSSWKDSLTIGQGRKNLVMQEFKHPHGLSVANWQSLMFILEREPPPSSSSSEGRHQILTPRRDLRNTNN